MSGAAFPSPELNSELLESVSLVFAVLHVSGLLVTFFDGGSSFELK